MVILQVFHSSCCAACWQVQTLNNEIAGAVQSNPSLVLQPWHLIGPGMRAASFVHPCRREDIVQRRHSAEHDFCTGDQVCDGHLCSTSLNTSRPCSLNWRTRSSEARIHNKFNKSSIERHCFSFCIWTTAGFPVQSAADCQCSPGYGYDPTSDFCTACLIGEYKAAMQRCWAMLSYS